MVLQPFVGPWLFLQFRNLSYTDGRTPWRSDQPVAKPLPAHRRTQTQNKCTQTSMSRVGFEPTIPAFERAKTVPALDRAATAIGYLNVIPPLKFYVLCTVCNIDEETNHIPGDEEGLLLVLCFPLTRHSEFTKMVARCSMRLLNWHEMSGVYGLNEVASYHITANWFIPLHRARGFPEHGFFMLESWALMSFSVSCLESLAVYRPLQLGA
jgi:hypothetical protein